MGLIGVASTDNVINESIKSVFNAQSHLEYTPRIPESLESLVEFLKFDLPEIVIINFADENMKIDDIMKEIRQDSWLHAFGIIGIYDRKKQNEKELLKSLREINVLVMIDVGKIKNHLLPVVKIIDENKQIIFHWELADKLVEQSTGSFVIDNNPMAASVYAGLAATTLVQRGFLDPGSRIDLQLALTELILNGIEHGNCGVTFDEKTKYLNQGKGMADLVADKCKDPIISSKKVFLEWEIKSDESIFVIRDEGKGFDVKKLKEKLKNSDQDALHGRGIMMARMFASKLVYNAVGNEAVFTVKHNTEIDRETPEGFSKAENIIVKRGDIVCREGEPSDYLFYISAGRYSVFHQSRQVGSLSPADIFVGEMSFLLNNQRSATVRAEGPGKLVKISRKSFISVVKEYPHYGIFLSKLLARKLVRANQVNAAFQAGVMTSNVGNAV